MRVRKLTPETSQRRRAQRKRATFARHRLRVLELLASTTEGETARHLRDTLNLTTSNARRVLRSLLDEGLIVPGRFEKHERLEAGYRIWGQSGDPLIPGGDDRAFIPGGPVHFYLI
jgi:hypothetical protein